MLEEKRFDKLEDELKEVSKATHENTIILTKLTTIMEKFIETSVEDVKKTLSDHEDRIRSNSKFVYQAVAVATVTSIVIGWAVRFL